MAQQVGSLPQVVHWLIQRPVNVPSAAISGAQEDSGVRCPPPHPLHPGTWPDRCPKQAAPLRSGETEAMDSPEACLVSENNQTSLECRETGPAPSRETSVPVALSTWLWAVGTIGPPGAILFSFMDGGCFLDGPWLGKWKPSAWGYRPQGKTGSTCRRCFKPLCAPASVQLGPSVRTLRPRWGHVVNRPGP